MVSWPPISIKKKFDSGPIFMHCSLSDDSEEEVVDVDVAVVLSVTIIISSVINEIFSEAEILESLISKIYKK